MSEHTSAIYIKHLSNRNPLELLKQLGFTGARYEGTVSMDDASSPLLSGVSVIQAGGWTLALNPSDMFGSGDLPEVPEPIFDGLWDPLVAERLRQLSVNTELFGYVAEGCTATYGFTYYVNGVLRRMHLWHHSAIKLNVGIPLPFEPASLTDFVTNEDVLFLFIDHLSPPDFRAMPFSHYSYDLPPGPKPGTFSDRFLTEYEVSILKRLLQLAFSWTDATAVQFRDSIVRQIDLSGTIECRDRTVMGTFSDDCFQVTAEADDIDGSAIRFLLLMSNGKVAKLEIARKDHSPPMRMPSPQELRLSSVR